MAMSMLPNNQIMLQNDSKGLVIDHIVHPFHLGHFCLSTRLKNENVHVIISRYINS
jgi:hypothetical protein